MLTISMPILNRGEDTEKQAFMGVAAIDIKISSIKALMDGANVIDKIRIQCLPCHMKQLLSHIITLNECAVTSQGFVDPSKHNKT